MTYNKTSYSSDDQVLHETDIGPEVTHRYQVERERERESQAETLQ